MIPHSPVPVQLLLGSYPPPTTHLILPRSLPTFNAVYYDHSLFSASWLPLPVSPSVPGFGSPTKDGKQEEANPPFSDPSSSRTPCQLRGGFSSSGPLPILAFPFFPFLPFSGKSAVCLKRVQGLDQIPNVVHLAVMHAQTFISSPRRKVGCLAKLLFLLFTSTHPSCHHTTSVSLVSSAILI
jgi:hypothetical protein